MALDPKRAREPLESFISEAMGVAPCRITKLDRLAGGTVQENWFVEAQAGPAFAQTVRLVLRTGRAVGVDDSLPAVHEFSVLSAAADAGVRVPRPVAACSDPAMIGSAFFLMSFVEGECRPWKLQRMVDVMAQGDSILEQIGAELGRLQSIVPGRGELECLKLPPRDVARQQIADLRAYLDTHEHPHVAIEYALRWLERNAPPPGDVVLCHGDFRNGNVMIAGAEPVAILDWELARWGDAHEDLGWFCMRFFRFARPDLAGGGLGRRAALLKGWQAATGRSVDPDLLRYWDIMANTRWAVVSLQQVARHVSGAEKSIELALVGLATAEMELEALHLIVDAPRGESPKRP
jgi:aminoglycoside phosphotransferase (APT) family kinase protein